MRWTSFLLLLLAAPVSYDDLDPEEDLEYENETIVIDSELCLHQVIIRTFPSLLLPSSCLLLLPSCLLPSYPASSKKQVEIVGKAVEKVTRMIAELATCLFTRLDSL